MKPALTLPVILLFSGLFSTAAPARSQEAASLNEVEALAARGRITEARETLEVWWTRRFETAPRTQRQRGVWLRGKLTVDPSMAEQDFRRLVLEFPGGSYSDDALHRLGLGAIARGELKKADSAFRSLVRDYPSSPHLPRAEEWIEAHEDEIESLPEPVDSLRARPTLRSPEEMGVGEFSVQLGAFRSLDRARTLAGELRSDGFEPRLVRTPGSDLAKVRVGRFPSRPPAEALARSLEERGYEVTLVTEASDEERIGEG